MTVGTKNLSSPDLRLNPSGRENRGLILKRLKFLLDPSGNALEFKAFKDQVAKIAA